MKRGIHLAILAAIRLKVRSQGHEKVDHPGMISVLSSKEFGIRIIELVIFIFHISKISSLWKSPLMDKYAKGRRGKMSNILNASQTETVCVMLDNIPVLGTAERRCVGTETRKMVATLRKECNLARSPI
ncbi:hypothetical protein FRX31_016879 [Thalictrum thalictroides]|uniref:Uncharacterized protein n=1 Tax=Thalictrum thalictroides TaxID=46969 RepID=A0A7J6WAX5_THATH|nr:hypothetical protein FRX31_016879 [Thalictrum thalictroides]